MKGLMEQALGAQWQALPPALQAHYQAADNVDAGRLSVEFPGWMFPALWLLRGVGALLHRRGQDLPTTVSKRLDPHGRQHWYRRVELKEGREMVFRSQWILLGEQRLIEFVNPILGLQMQVTVDDGKLYYRGERFVLQLGRWRLPLPEALLGHTTIEEYALDEQRFGMDFRLTHPLFGQIYRYHGVFTTHAQSA